MQLPAVGRNRVSFVMLAQMILGTMACSLRCFSVVVRDSLTEEASLEKSGWIASNRLAAMRAMSQNLEWLELEASEVDSPEEWGVQLSLHTRIWSTPTDVCLI